MNESAKDGRKCDVCGETDPWPAALCLMRLDARGRAAAQKAGRCQYSREADERMRIRFAEILDERPAS